MNEWTNMSYEIYNTQNYLKFFNLPIESFYKTGFTGNVKQWLFLFYIFVMNRSHENMTFIMTACNYFAEEMVQTLSNSVN